MTYKCYGVPAAQLRQSLRWLDEQLIDVDYAISRHDTKLSELKNERDRILARKDEIEAELKRKESIE
ncbi:hypothetical protein OZL92_20820 [Bacillus sonorensis]|mgnify:CR=1 FL=1|uniref:Uncharacterized protein n=2 Tax=Bacillus sonorensis TaxID=119858 RepID=M5PF92_9BACI|nr:hypothetical protein [Bacillus sonorensis]ASB90468.1 hypothetical protein S101395_03965 [Bacillus sonorensis]EME76195.1 hypothetical protein BSONL12_04454 [Bacillus sonorensis L12]MCZ0074664.1 hypothetical protein [Bacillus sonorensis]MCZ0093772.1 hypothetical protein [Bacillus sonorensis]PAD61839.1 hypothetical protein CHH92_01930 [Bacillus sonorensis]